MATFISLLSFTDQGVRNVKQTTERASVFRQWAQKSGVTVKNIFWTMGAYDAVVVMEADRAEAIMSLLTGLGSLGNVRTETLRGFTEQEMVSVLEDLS